MSVTQGYPVAIELSPELLEKVVNVCIPWHQQFTFGANTYSLVSPARLTLDGSQEGAGEGRQDLIGVVVKIADGSGNTGQYALYFSVQEGTGRIRLAFDHVDRFKSRPLPMLNAKTVEAGLRMPNALPPMQWSLSQGMGAVRPRIKPNPDGRIVVFVTTPDLERQHGLSPVADPTITGSRLYRPDTGAYWNRPERGLHPEHWAVMLDEKFARGFFKQQLVASSPFRLKDGNTTYIITIEDFEIPKLINGGIEVKLQVKLRKEGSNESGSRFTISGPLYIGSKVDPTSLPGQPKMRVTANAKDLKAAEIEGIALFVKILLTIFLPPAGVASWIIIPGLIQHLFNKPLGQKLESELDSRAAKELQGLLSAVPQTVEGPRAPGQGRNALLLEHRLVQLRLRSDGMVLGVWTSDRHAQAGGERVALRVPRVSTAYPSSFMIGMHEPGDCFPPFESDAVVSVEGVDLDTVKAVRLSGSSGNHEPKVLSQTGTTLKLQLHLPDLRPGSCDLELDWDDGRGSGTETKSGLFRAYVYAEETVRELAPRTVWTRDGMPALVEFDSGLIMPVERVGEWLEGRDEDHPPVAPPTDEGPTILEGLQPSEPLGFVTPDEGLSVDPQTAEGLMGTVAIDSAVVESTEAIGLVAAEGMVALGLAMDVAEPIAVVGLAISDGAVEFPPDVPREELPA